MSYHRIQSIDHVQAELLADGTGGDELSHEVVRDRVAGEVLAEIEPGTARSIESHAASMYLGGISSGVQSGGGSGASKAARRASASSGSRSSQRDSQSATELSLPEMCLTRKTKDWSHRTIFGTTDFSMKRRLLWSVSTMNGLQWR